MAQPSATDEHEAFCDDIHTALYSYNVDVCNIVTHDNLDGVPLQGACIKVLYPAPPRENSFVAGCQLVWVTSEDPLSQFSALGVCV